MKSMKRTLALLLFAMFSVGALGACNTVAGVGEDIESVGDSFEDVA